MKHKSVVELFTKEPHRWIRGQTRDSKGNVCLAGAVEEVHGTGVETGRAFNRLYAILEKRGGDRLVSSFNDRSDTTVNDVIQLAKEAKV